MNAEIPPNDATFEPVTFSEMLQTEMPDVSRRFFVNSLKPTDPFPDLSATIIYRDNGVYINTDFVQIASKYRPGYSFLGKKESHDLLWTLRDILETTHGWIDCKDFIYVNHGVDMLSETVKHSLTEVALMPLEGRTASSYFKALYHRKFAYIWVTDMNVPAMNAFRRCQLTSIELSGDWNSVLLGFKDQGRQVKKGVPVTMLPSVEIAWIVFEK
jgi:hypothetical protein